MTGKKKDVLNEDRITSQVQVPQLQINSHNTTGDPHLGTGPAVYKNRNLQQPINSRCFYGFTGPARLTGFTSDSEDTLRIRQPVRTAFKTTENPCLSFANTANN